MSYLGISTLCERMIDLLALRTYFLDVRHAFVQMLSAEGSEVSVTGI